MTEANTEPPKPRTAPSGALQIREPEQEDGGRIWKLVDHSTLDTNSPYSYLMMFAYFSDTCVVAEEDGEVQGFITGFRRPDHPERLFIWQIGVAPSARGKGLGTAMLQHLMQREAQRDVRFLEATVNPSNAASLRLFRAMAEKLSTRCQESLAFAEELFPGDSHEEERMLRVGPIAPEARTADRTEGEGLWI